MKIRAGFLTLMASLGLGNCQCEQDILITPDMPTTGAGEACGIIAIPAYDKEFSQCKITDIWEVSNPNDYTCGDGNDIHLPHSVANPLYTSCDNTANANHGTAQYPLEPGKSYRILGWCVLETGTNNCR